MPISVQSRKFAVLIVHHFQTKKPVFLSRSLPFGACSSVYSFNRVSRGIWYLASHGCKAMGGVYFDDFPFLEPSSLCTLASQSIEGLLKALGWTYTTDPSKCYPFSESFDVLGARLSVGGLHGQSFSLQNKPGRLDKIAELVSEVQRNKTITKRQAQVIHGNMNFAMSFVMGHTLKVAARAFSALSTDACVYSKKQLVSLCIWTKEILTFLSPRTIDPKGPLSPVLIFTDAAYEMDTATWGVVFIDPLTGTRTAEGGTVPQFLVKQWHALGSEQVITLAEAFAALLARHMFRDCIKQRRVLFFIDNEGARYSLIRGASNTLALLQIVQLFLACSEYDHALHWIERVPSSSNIADLPSRGKTSEALSLINGLPWPFPYDVQAVATLCVDFSGLPELLIYSPLGNADENVQTPDDITGE